MDVRQTNQALSNAFDTKDVTNSLGRIGLETAGNALVAAITGGNAGAAAASTAAGDFASIVTRQP